MSLVPAIRGATFAGRPVTHTQGGFESRWISVADTRGRLTYLGVPPTSPVIASFVESARIGGPSFTATPALPAAAQEGLRTEMVTWLRGLAQGRTAARSSLQSWSSH